MNARSLFAVSSAVGFLVACASRAGNDQVSLPRPESLPPPKEPDPAVIQGPSSVPTLYIFSSENCPPCGLFFDQFEMWVDGGYCKLQLKKIDIEKEDWRAIPNLPKLKGRVPIIILQNSNGSWQEFEQWFTGDFKTVGEYSLYLFNEIESCQVGTETTPETP